jgi:hypothetical protein
VFPLANNINKPQTKQVKEFNKEGSKYHQEHAGNVEGYGEPHPVDGKTTKNKK